ncbi:TPA: nucleoside phosphorylase [Candidatus Woesearchaeota archaeon]|nr:nucleoside phosphorylase [Candidatus Woesearchaeota archaeon]
MNKPIAASELIIINGRVYHIGTKADELASQIFVTGDPGRVDAVANHFDNIRSKVSNREYITVTGTFRGMPVSVMSTGIGTDNNDIAVVEAHACNAIDLDTRIEKDPTNVTPLTVIRLGTSGGPQPDITIGTLAISSYALGLDNTGIAYNFPPADQVCKDLNRIAYEMITAATPDGNYYRGWLRPYSSKATPEVVEALARQAQLKGFPHAVGITASTSSFYGGQGRQIPGFPLTVNDLPDVLERLRVGDLRVVNIEMESSLLFQLLTGVGYRCGTICPVIAGRAEGTFIEPDVKAKSIERTIEVGLAAMHDLYTKDRAS